jgi:ADP-heptose:LPS heptosyltransferase
MLLKRWLDDAELSAAEYARLAERGYIDVLNENGNTKVIPYCVILENEVIKANLLAVGSQIKKRHWDELCRLRDTFTNALLSRTPPHLHKARLFGLQHTFFSDPWFILYVLKNLTESGKLKMPTAEQKKMLITIITKDK